MSTSEIRLERLTRREFRQALDDGHFQVAILDKAVEGVAEVVHDMLGR